MAQMEAVNHLQCLVIRLHIQIYLLISLYIFFFCSLGKGNGGRRGGGGEVGGAVLLAFVLAAPIKLAFHFCRIKSEFSVFQIDVVGVHFRTAINSGTHTHTHTHTHTQRNTCTSLLLAFSLSLSLSFGFVI